MPKRKTISLPLLALASAVALVWGRGAHSRGEARWGAERSRGTPFSRNGKSDADEETPKELEEKRSFISLAWTVLKTALAEWSRHRSARMGAALAYYSVFSLGPLLLLVVAFAGLFFGPDAVRGSLTGQFRSLLGDTGGKALEALLVGAASKSSGQLAAAVGVVLVLVSAVGIVAQLKDAMNTIWNVEDPKETSIWWYIRTYFISSAAVLALGLLLTVSLVVSAALSAISAALGGGAAAASSFWQAINFLVSLAVLSVLFGMLFKWFPDTVVRWREVWLGAVATALLFNIGKLVIGLYVGSQGLESTYGAAASIVVLLVWVYYSAQIVLFGAELTHAYAVERSARLQHKAKTTSPNTANRPQPARG